MNAAAVGVGSSPQNSRREATSVRIFAEMPGCVRRRTTCNSARGEAGWLGAVVDVVKQIEAFGSCLVATPRLVALLQFAALLPVDPPHIEGAYV